MSSLRRNSVLSAPLAISLPALIEFVKELVPLNIFNPSMQYERQSGHDDNRQRGRRDMPARNVDDDKEVRGTGDQFTDQELYQTGVEYSPTVRHPPSLRINCRLIAAV